MVIDFGKARFLTNPKHVMSLSASVQEKYQKLYPHIATEIVQGTGQQSVASDIFSLGGIALQILDLLPAATAHSLRIAKKNDLGRSKETSITSRVICCSLKQTFG